MKYRGSPQLRLNFSLSCNKFRRLQLATNTVNTHTVSHCSTHCRHHHTVAVCTRTSKAHCTHYRLLTHTTGCLHTHLPICMHFHLPKTCTGDSTAAHTKTDTADTQAEITRDSRDHQRQQSTQRRSLETAEITAEITRDSTKTSGRHKIHTTRHRRGREQPHTYRGRHRNRQQDTGAYFKLLLLFSTTLDYQHYVAY